MEELTITDENIKLLKISSIKIPDRTELHQNYPNPFNPTTRIGYSVKEENLVTIKLYDMLGREVAILLNEIKTPGEYSIELDAHKLGLSGGVYLYQMKCGDFSSIKKLAFVK